MSKTFIVFLFVSLFLVACGEPEPDLLEGTVVDKSYDDPDYIPPVWHPGTPEVCSGGYGTTPRTCTPGTPGHHSPGYTEPADCDLQVAGYNVKGKYVVRWFDTDCDDFDYYHRGSKWPREGAQ